MSLQSQLDPHARLESELGRLRAEQENAETDVARAILMHEVAVLEEELGDSSAAARDQLDAVNAEPEFHEPLERLIRIIQKSGSSKNLGKLLERLSQVAEGADERVRALLERASHLTDVEVDSDAARTVLEEAADEKPDEAAVFLALEALAGRVGDAELRARSLATRAELCQHPSWRALLLLDAAELALADGDIDAAIERIERAIEQKGEATFAALRALEIAGKRAERFDVVARSLEAQAALLLRGASDGTIADTLGVPRHACTAAHAADAWLRAADAHRRRGEVGDAAALLDQALSKVDDEPALVHARLVAAEVTGDTHKSAELAMLGIERGAKGGIAAALWLRAAESAASQGDLPSALQAVEKALAEDPACIPARVLQLDLLDPGQDPQALASALETTAELMSSEAAKARYFMLAADTWARLGKDAAGAKAALSQAGMYGAPPLTVARVARMLSALMGEAAWYEEATRRLIAAHAGDDELSGLWFELGRSRLLRGDLEHAKAAFASLAELERGRWLGAALRAYALPLALGSADTDSEAALAMLATMAAEPRTGAALRTAMAVRALFGQRDKDALEQLGALSADDPANVVAAASVAALSRKHGAPVRAAETLSKSAAAVADGELGCSFDLEAGILFWQGGERARAVECFTRASERSPAAGGAILGWALRAAEPDSLDARRRALGASEDSASGILALERFGLEMQSGGDRDAAVEALDLVASAEEQDLRDAGLLARSLTAPDEERREALEGLASYGGASDAVACAAAHVAELEKSDPDPARRLETSAKWAESDEDVVPALEWLAAAVGAENLEAEVAAKKCLADRLPGAQASLLRASAAVVSLLDKGDSELLDDPSEAARLTNLELAAPGCDPRRRARALAGVEGAFGEEGTALARALSGWSLMLAGEADAALEAFRAVVEAHPEEIIGWEGLRVTGELMGDRTVVAEASAALGDAVHDDQRGAELWEESAFILIDELGDTTRGEFALSRAVARDIGRAKAFDKLFRLVRGRKDSARLLELVSLRLEVAEEPEEIAKLYWERARVLRESGDRDGALSALENVTLLEPDHVGALALSGEIYLTSGKLPEAAEKLARLSTLSEAPAKQRLMSGVAAVDIYENKLGEIEKALAVLDGLYRSGLSTLPVRERFARAAAKAGDWEKATEVLEQLMSERESREGRIEAARLCLVIFRDRLSEPGRAAKAAARLLAESPDDGEALDLVLSGALSADVERPLLENGQRALVAQLLREPLDAERVDRLARIAARINNAPLRQAALGSLVALGEGSPEIDRELAILDQRVARVPQIAIDPRALPDLCDPEDAGPIPDLVAAMANTFAEALGPNLATFGVGKKERIDPRSGLPVRNEIAAWVGALGVGDFELYVGGPDDQGIFGVGTEVPALVVGRGVQAPLSPLHRQALARELFALKRGTTILRHRDSTDVAALVVATCRVGGYEMPSPQYAMLGEFSRVLGKEISRKVKKILPELAARAAGSGQDPIGWVRAATSSLDRLASIAAGDVSWVLSGVGQPRGQLGASMEAQERTSRILAFVLSPTYLMLREQLGMGVR